MSKLLSALLFSAAFIVPGVALADPPDTRCAPIIIDGEVIEPDARSPGAFNKSELTDPSDGPIGHQAQATGIGANLIAADRNQDRGDVCPPPGKPN